MAETLDPALPAEIQDRAEVVLELAHTQRLLISTAESCTGGLLAALLTDVPGRSHVFERGFVVYSNHAKCDLLGIARHKVDSCGAVSREIAIEMACGTLRRSRADIALSLTAFAGPAGDDDEEGLVHFACTRRDASVQHEEAHFGPIGRQGVRIEALNVALRMLEEGLRT